ncbi:N-acetylglucosamine-6-phosphate deacetylase [bacterium]|nr:N-acetylglucosamine-6-phosphate deacetylase [Akkermansiaceae bacterium]MDB4485597.1 N-acetylglucosamine-6-phosphate deacetylase [bacterium]MDA7916964.1 N-acetylglucosamine-6-phosphate deacetylase [Akkermansiaceae bacterium]MDB4282402.1 N-acetylglucosamine-6-phosphate deacetylase [Akkermansiaceae bacterium]MDB4412100.1 N-acetylglucosamine-6-phosphate deacetylase [Akkermansiaceae bacterium]
MILSNAHLISPGLEIPEGFLQIEEGEIFALGPMSELPKDDHVIDLAGKRLLPGGIDIHCHGADGADTCDASVASLQHIAETKLKEGVTTWLPTTLTQPAEKLVDVVSTIAEWAPHAPLSVPGCHLEGPYINREQAGAQNPEFTRLPDPLELRALNELFPSLILSLAPELPGALEMISEARSLGITPSAAHSTADAATIGEAIGFGLTHLTHFGNAMTGLHHREIGMVGSGIFEENLMLEIIADGIHLCDDMLRLLLKVVSVERLMLITDSVAASWQPDGESSLGGLEVIIKDGETRLKRDGSLAGSMLRFNHGLRRLADLWEGPLHEIVAVGGANQARSLGLCDRGHLEIGKRADLVVINDDFEVLQTYVSGERRYSSAPET